MPLLSKRVICSLIALCLWSAGTESLWSQAFLFSTLAGNAGYGSADGPTNQARFNFPQGVAADNAGNVYVADTAECLYVADTDNNTIRLGQTTSVSTVSLQATSAAGQIILSWPTASAGFVLETKTDIFSNTWNPVTNLDAAWAPPRSYHL